MKTRLLKTTRSLRPFAIVCAFVSWITLGSLTTRAQSAEFTQNKSGNHAMTLEVSLASYPGRGISLPVTLRYSSAGLWRIGFMNTVPMGSSVWRSVNEAIYAEHSTAGWTTSLDIPRVEWPRQNDIYWYTGKPYPRSTVPPFTFRVAQLFMHMPGGSTHEMRKADAVYQDNGTIDMTGTFYSVDGTRMRYESSGQNSGTLYLPDGSRYLLSSSTVQFIDRNGNRLNYNVSNRQWTDTMGRVVGMPWPVNPGPGDYSYSLPGINNSSVVYTLKFRSLSAVLTPNQGQMPALKVLADHYLPDPNSAPTGIGTANFPQASQGASLFASDYSDQSETSSSFAYVVGRGQSGSSLFNPTVLSEIVFPNGQSYKFSYNVYGELEKVVYPTGAYQRYQYSQVPTIGLTAIPYLQGSRGVTTRVLSPNGTGGTDEAQWQYSTSVNPLTITAPDGTRSEIYLFNPGSSTQNFGYRDARRSSVTEERVYAPSSQGGAMLRRTLYEYAQTSVTINKPVTINTVNTGTYTAYRNARPIKLVNIILDTGAAAHAKTVSYEYDSNNLELSTGLDRTASTESHFQSIDQTTAQTGLINSIPAGPTAARVETTYLEDSAYQARNILGLATTVILKGIVNGTLQEVARTDSFYDESAFPLLTYGDLVASEYTDPMTGARGNVTTTKRYVDAAATTYLQTHAQFDQCGNVRTTWNERGAQSQTDYSSTYKHAYPTQVTSEVPDPSGAHGSNTPFTSSSTFDFTTGLALTTTDVNGQVTSFSYKDDLGVTDPLSRLRKVTRPDGGWTKYTFGDGVGNLFKIVESRQDTTRTIKAHEYFDPMGRPSRSFVSEGGNSFIATDTIYDQMGRTWKVSNPYRTTALNGVAALSNTNHWTISSYDPLGRVVSLTLPDGSALQTKYEGVYTTVTDQAGKQQRQKTDALGRIVRVDEPNTSGSLGDIDFPAQPTVFEYDTQGNLVHIAQGSNPVQHRYFKYDALRRLTHEHQVEQVAAFTAFDPVTGHSNWSRRLVYDETFDGASQAGLLTSTIDARNVETELRYDNLNRAYQISYSDGTPAVTNNYDQPRTGYFNKGHLTEALTAAVGATPSTAQLFNFDLMGRVVNNQQKVGAQTYSMSYTYNLGGALVGQTYPSGRVVNYAFDDGARLSQVSSGTKVYASQFNYAAVSGMLTSVTLGNGAVENYVYNSRLQLQSLDLMRNGTQLQRYEYKYGVYNPSTNTLDETRNNNQIAQIEGFIGTQKQWQQRFTYDYVDRLTSAREFRGDNGQQSYLVNYEYDVFGNRYQKQLQNGGNPFAQVWVEANQIDQITNRLTTGLTYDNAGNVVTDSKFRLRKFQYDANNRQKQSRNLNDTGAVDSIFDAGGQRVATQVGGVLRNVMVYDATGRLVAEYGEPSGLGGTHYLFNDHQGSPRVTTNSQGVVVSRQDYLPFGEDVLNAVGLRTAVPGYGQTAASRRKYAGMESNEATGMAHTLWRQYDSLSGRWTAPDPYRGSMAIGMPQTLNRYTYVDNDPVNQVDPDGLMPMLPDASTSWSEVSGDFWGTSFGGPVQQNHIAEGMARHDSIIETGYDPAFGVYRGEVTVEYIPDGGGYMNVQTLNNPTPEELGATMDSMERGADMAQSMLAKNRPGRPSRNPRKSPQQPQGPYRPRTTPAARSNVHGAATQGGKNTVKYVLHHVFPQQQSLRKYFNNAGVNIHGTTLLIPETIHKQLHKGAGGGIWNSRWEQFFRENPKATKKQIYKFLFKLDMEYNLAFHSVYLGPYFAPRPTAPPPLKP